MENPSTTQALFALIVMIIVLLFILVYCCWGTMTCGRAVEQINPSQEDVNTNIYSQNQNSELPSNTRAVVIFPLNSMIYVGDGQNRRIYHIPSEDEKPPSYTDLYTRNPPPPYSSSISPNNVENQAIPLDQPPSYEDYLNAVRSPALTDSSYMPSSQLSTTTTTSSSISNNNNLESNSLNNNNNINNEANEKTSSQIPKNITFVLRGNISRISMTRENSTNTDSEDKTTTDSSNEIISPGQSSSIEDQGISSSIANEEERLRMEGQYDFSRSNNQNNSSDQIQGITRDTNLDIRITVEQNVQEMSTMEIISENNDRDLNFVTNDNSLSMNSDFTSTRPNSFIPDSQTDVLDVRETENNLDDNTVIDIENRQNGT